MNRIWFWHLILIFAVLAVNCEKEPQEESLGQTSPAVKPNIEKPGVVAPGAEPIELATIDQYARERSKTEGPVADADGNVYFSNPYGTKVYKWSPDGMLSIFTENFNGPNGLAIDKDGNLIACEAYNRRITSLSQDGKKTVLADSFNGKKFNEPNDLFIDRKGGIYFSDPYFHVHSDPLEHESRGVYYIPPDRSKVIRVIDDMINPNGISSAPDGSQLYVIDTGKEKTYVYTVNADGTLKDKRLFVPWGIDGLTVDNEGNVYITGRENYVNIYDVQGTNIGKIAVPITKGHTANVCFGGKDNKTLFITAGNSLFSIRMRVKGL